MMPRVGLVNGRTFEATAMDIAIDGCIAYLHDHGNLKLLDISDFEPCASVGVPAAPDSLVIHPVASNVRLNWAPVLSDTSGNPITVTRYVVYSSADAAAWDSIGTPTPADTTVFAVTDISALRKFYQVRAVVE